MNKKIAGLLAVIGAAVAAVGTFLPFFTVSLLGFSESINYISGGDGIIFIVLSIVTVVLYFVKKAQFTAIPAALSLLLVLFTVINGNSEVKEFGDMVSTSIGAYICIIGAAVSTVGGVFSFLKKNDAE